MNGEWPHRGPKRHRRSLRNGRGEDGGDGAGRQEEVIDEGFLRFLGRSASESEVKTGALKPMRSARRDMKARRRAGETRRRFLPTGEWEKEAGGPVTWTRLEWSGRHEIAAAQPH